jgi:hypothetical protein
MTNLGGSMSCKVILKSPFETPQVAEFTNLMIEEIEEKLGTGLMEALIVANDLAILFDPNGEQEGMLPNCEFLGRKIFGTVIICGKEKDMEEVKISKLPVDIKCIKRVFPALWE